VSCSSARGTQVTDSAHIHWTEIEENLEQYLLHRLNAKQREVFDAHLKPCEQCRARILAEMKLVATIRNYGRSEVKMRLRHHIQTPARPRLPARRVFGIAAIVFATLTAGITAIWLMRQQTRHPVMEKEEIVQAPVSSSSAEGKKTEQPEVPTAGEQRKSVSRPKGGSAGRPPALDIDLSRARSKPAESDKMHPEGKPSVASSDAEGGAGGAIAQQRREGQTGSVPSSAMPGASVWIEGRVLEAYQAKVEHQNTPEDFQQKDYSGKESDGTLTDQSAKPPMFVYADSVISLQQRPISDLPPLQRSQYIAGAGNRVCTLLQKTPQGLQFTLYLEPLLDQPVVGRAHVQVVNTDSMIVDTPRFRISYKLPPRWIIPQLQPTKPQR
jgi:hypothetical protein